MAWRAVVALLSWWETGTVRSGRCGTALVATVRTRLREPAVLDEYDGGGAAPDADCNTLLHRRVQTFAAMVTSTILHSSTTVIVFATTSSVTTDRLQELNAIQRAVETTASCVAEAGATASTALDPQKQADDKTSAGA